MLVNRDPWLLIPCDKKRHKVPLVCFRGHVRGTDQVYNPRWLISLGLERSRQASIAYPNETVQDVVYVFTSSQKQIGKIKIRGKRNNWLLVGQFRAHLRVGGQ